MALTLTSDERAELERRLRSLKIRAEDARRARVILMLADGASYSTIEATVPCFRDYINRWRKRFQRYMQSDDPDFETKAAHVIGLYVNPPDHAAVFAVDEKTAIQALDRLDPVLPLSPGRAERHGFEYYRHGTLS